MVNGLPWNLKTSQHVNVKNVIYNSLDKGCLVSSWDLGLSCWAERYQWNTRWKASVNKTSKDRLDEINDQCSHQSLCTFHQMTLCNQTQSTFIMGRLSQRNNLMIMFHVCQQISNSQVQQWPLWKNLHHMEESRVYRGIRYFFLIWSKTWW